MRFAVIAATLLVAVNAMTLSEVQYSTCHNEKTTMGETRIMTITEGETYTIRCPVKQTMFCKWHFDNMEIPSTMGNVFISTSGSLRFKSPTVHNSGWYTVDAGNSHITYYIIVMPVGLTEMSLDPETRVVKDMEFRDMWWYNHYVHDITFENVKFYNIHWQLIKMKNVRFVNCTFHWDTDKMWPMQAEFHYSKFEHSSWNRVQLKDSSFVDCTFSQGHHVYNDQADMDTYYTFFMHHIHNTVFCNVQWYDTHWASGRWYNVTFNYNVFTHHYQYEEHFMNFHYKTKSCQEYDPETDTMVQWVVDSNGDCQMLVHTPDSMYYDRDTCMSMTSNRVMKYVCGDEHSSTRFWDCKFEASKWDHCNMDSVEWRHVMHHKSMFMRSEMTANNFVMTKHKDCHWTNMMMLRWNRFTANSFNDHENHWIKAEYVYHHSCKFYHSTWDCRNCMAVHFEHTVMENVKLEKTCHFHVWHMHDCSTLGLVMQGWMDTYQFCRVHHNDISWLNYQLTMHEDVCPNDTMMQHHQNHACKHRPHDYTCKHMWMNPEYHCCYGYMSCHMMPHQFWMRDNLQCRDNDYEWSWRMGEWRNYAERDMYYRMWGTSEYDPHSWSTHHKLPMVHCLNAMKKFPMERSMTLRHIQGEDPTVMNAPLTTMMNMYNMQDVRSFYKTWKMKMVQFYDHWNCLHMFEY